MKKTSLGFNIHNKPSVTNDEDVNVDEFLIDNFVLANKLIVEDRKKIQSNIVQTNIVKVTTEIKELTEYELPCSYIVRFRKSRNILQ